MKYTMKYTMISMLFFKVNCLNLLERLVSSNASVARH